jgi:hypothetical protein
MGLYHRNVKSIIPSKEEEVFSIRNKDTVDTDFIKIIYSQFLLLLYTLYILYIFIYILVSLNYYSIYNPINACVNSILDSG